MSEFDEREDKAPGSGAVAATGAAGALPDSVVTQNAEAPSSEPIVAADEPRWVRVDVVADPDAALVAAQRAVAAGECIVLPTDTVYGIGVGAFLAEAVTRLLEAKRRGRDMPPPVLIAEPAMLGALATSVNATATSLAEAHWPGPLTLILTAHPSLHLDLGDTRGTIAVRVPDHDFTRELLRRTGPLAVSSANTSGNPASTTIDAAIEQLGNAVSVYLDAGPTRDDAPSTIVDFSGSSVGRVVRNGAIPLEILREKAPQIVGIPVLEDETAQEPEEDAEPGPDEARAGTEALEDARSGGVVSETADDGPAVDASLAGALESRSDSDPE